MKPKNQSLKDLSKAKKDLRFSAVEIRFLSKKDPYTAVIVSLAVIDELLEARITEKLIYKNTKLLDNFFASTNAFAYSLSAKIHLAHALGVFGPHAYSDLNALRKIRNSIAHGNNVIEFDSPTIKDLCSQLWSVREHLTPQTITDLPTIELFCLSAMHLAAGLSERPVGVSVSPMP